MASKTAARRLAKEAQMMDKDPPPFCYGRPREDNVLEWHFILRGPPETPFHGGEYWGQLIFPPEYPYKPPGIKVSTPSGRFHTDMKICTSMSDFHPGSWNPAWSVANILVGLLSFMCTDEMTTGSVMATQADRGTLAQRSHAFNITQPRFKRMFPEYCAPAIRELPNMGESKAVKEGASSSTSASGGGDATAATKTGPASSVPYSQVNAKQATGISSGTGGAAATTLTSGASQAQAQGRAQAPLQPQGRSRAIFPIIVALAAYLFVSRVASILGGGSGPPTTSA